MKNEDLLLYGGLAVVAYLLLVPKTVAPGVSTVAPVSAALPGTSTSNVANTALTALAALAPAVTKYLTTPSASSVSPSGTTSSVNPVSSLIQQPVFTPVTPVASYTDPSLATFAPTLNLTQAETPTDDFTSLELMEQNNAYPGADISGVGRIKAAALGLY